MKRHLLIFFGLLGFLSASGADFTSNVAAGNWNVAGSWTVVGVDADGIPDADDNVTIASGHTITLQGTSNCDDITVSGGGTLNYNNKALMIRGNFTRTGTTSSAGVLYFYGNPATITITGTYNNGGNWNILTGSNVTIAAGATILKANYFNISTGGALTNNSNVNLTSGSVALSGTGTFTAGASSTLAVAYPLAGSAGFNFTAAGNRMRYSTNNTPTILRTTYYHLDLINSTTSKSWSGGALTVNGDLRIFSGCTLDFNLNDLNLGGNWVNFANTTCLDMGSVNFTGAGTQTIDRSTGTTEIFNTLNLNGVGTVTPLDSLQVNGSLSINSGELDVTTSNYNIHCKVNFTNSGSFNGRQGTVFMDGSAAQTIGGSSLTSFYNLTTNNDAGISVTSNAQISNILYVAAGPFGTSGVGTVTLLATASTTAARIAPLSGTASLSGTGWIIQTYINGPATAYWQYLGSPTTTSTVGDWDGDTRFYMSGVGGNDGTACCPTFYSVRTYNTATNTYSNVTSTGTALTPGRGFSIWMGDNMTSLTSPLIFDSRGTPNSGSVNRAVSAGGAGSGYNLVSNPMACPVTYATVVAASSATLNADFLILTESGAYSTSPNGGTIAAAQGFLCQATVSGNITFTESSKSLTATPNVIRAIAGNQIRITASNEVNGLGEETVVRLNPIGDAAYNETVDLPYIASPYDNATHLWTRNADGSQFILNDIGTSEDHLMIPVSVTASTPGGQILTFKDLNTVTEYNCAWLEDLTTGARINLNSTDTYSFEEEMGATRNFILHLERTNDCTFDLQNSEASLDAQTNVFVNNGQIYAGFEFETEEIVTISMYDLSGRIVMGETTMNVGTQTVALTNPDAHGIYLVRIVKGNEVSTKKIYY